VSYDFDALTVAVDGGVALLTMTRPETRNVISDEPLVTELAAACRSLNEDPDIRAVVLTGAGTAFSAGGNVRKMQAREGMFGGQPHEIAAAYRRGIQQLIQSVWGLEVPTIAAVNGPAIGAGFDLALACDLRLASSTAKFGETFVTLGLVPGDGGSWLLPRAVGNQRAAELAFTGRIVDADEARELGIVLSVHEPADLVAAAMDLGSRIAEQPAVAMRYTKRLIRHGANLGLAELLDETADVQAMLHGTAEHLAAVERLLARQDAAKQRK
jgi:enoyl-CoA hydratase/carnithine racemase